MEPDWDLVSSGLERQGELGTDQEGVHGRRDHVAEQRWLLGHLCPPALPTQHSHAQRTHDRACGTPGKLPVQNREQAEPA